MNYKMLYATNHMLMGWLYILVGLVGGSMGYGLSMLLSFELSCSGYVLMSWLQYNSIITFHGIYMIFFMMMPILMGGLGNMLIPLMLFSSDMMFPSVNALSMWLLILSLYWMILAMMVNGGVNSGWTFYVPLSTMNLSSFDLMMFSMHFSGLSSIIGSINFITTMLTRSLKYAMDLYPLSLFPLSILSTSMLLILSVPVLAGCITMILLDSNFNTSFYDPIRGGDCLLFQHLFWFFGHPEVYMLMLPAFGIVSEVLSSASLVSMFGRDSMILAMLMIVVLGSMVWGHHMFMVS